MHEFTLFKRQSEDFNVKVTGSKTIEISRAHSVRNILSFELSKDLPLEEWVDITIVYRQRQKEEEENDDMGLKIYLNSEKVFQDSKLNFKWPLYETDGVIFFQGFKGAFTEIRFWNANISENIIKETYNCILGCVYEQRKRVQMDDDQFSFLNQKRKKAKRGTLVAPPGKSLGGLKSGLRSSLRKPARGSIKTSLPKFEVEKQSVEDQIKEEEEEHEETIETSPKKDPEQIPPKDEFGFEFKAKKPVKDKPKETFWDDEGFDAPPPKKDTEDSFGDFDWSSKKEEKNINDDGFDWNDEPANKDAAQEPTDDWDFEQKESKPTDDGFGDDDQKDEFEIKKDQHQEEEKVEKIEEENPELNDDKQSEDEKDEDHENEQEKESSEKNEPTTDEKDEQYHDPQPVDNLEGDQNEDQIADSQTPQDDPNTGWEEDPQDISIDDADENDGEGCPDDPPPTDPSQDDFNFDSPTKPPQDDFDFDTKPAKNTAKDDFDFDQDQQPQEKPQDDFGFDNETEPQKATNQDDFGFDDTAKEPKQNKDDFNFDDDKHAQPTSSQDDFGFDEPEPSKQQEDPKLNSKKESQEQSNSDDFGFDQNTSTQPQNKDDFGFGDENPSQQENPSDDFGFDNSPQKDTEDFGFDQPKANPKDDDFNFESKPSSKQEASEDFDFDFGGPPKQNAAKDQDFDFDFAPNTSQNKSPTQDDFSFDDFGPPKEQKKDQEPVKEEREEEDKQQENEEEENKENSFSEREDNKKRSSIALRKFSIEVPEDDQQDNTFMNECVEAIKQDIINFDYSNALNTIESNMNELIYDYKELERNKHEESEEDYKANLKSLKENIRFLTFYKLGLNIFIQADSFKRSTLPTDQEYAASLMNLLVLPPVHNEVRKIFYMAALRENLKFRNYKVALKLLKSFHKQISDLTEEEKLDIEEIKAECEQNLDKGVEMFTCVECPKCRENLPFGHATPSCQKCETKLLFCNETLIPLVQENTVRCYICFATYDNLNSSLFLPNDPSLCPNCRFGELQQIKAKQN